MALAMQVHNATAPKSQHRSQHHTVHRHTGRCSSTLPIHIGHIRAPLFLAPLLPLALHFRLPLPPFAARPLRSHVRPLELERLAAVELDRVAPVALVLVPVEVGGDAALSVHVRAARAVDLHPLVHEGSDLRACEGRVFVYVEA